jgi:competence protein ComEC
VTRLVIFTGAWVLGVLLTQASIFSPVWLLLCIPAALVLGLGWRNQPKARKAVWFLVGLPLGAGRFLWAQPQIDPGHIAYYNNMGPVAVEGVVIGEPDKRFTHTNLRLDVDTLHPMMAQSEAPSMTVTGRVLVNVPPYAEVQYGDRVRVVGRLTRPPIFETFSYREYLAQQGIYSLLRGAEVAVLASHQACLFMDYVLRFKAYALRVLPTLLSEPQASLLTGILLGVESGIPERVMDDFTATGTSHIIVISGFNLALVAGMFTNLARRLGKRHWRLPLALTGVWVYTLLVGASAAVLRSALMATVGVVAQHSGRKVHGPTSLATAVWVMSLINPYILWDVGFQLSFAATLGLILYTKPLSQGVQHLFERRISSTLATRFVAMLDESVIVTLAAQLTTTPVLIGRFHRFSLVTLISNFLILPAQPFVMTWGGLALIAGMAIRPIGEFLGWIAWLFLTYTIGVVSKTAEIPHASVEITHGPTGPALTLPLIWGYYLLLGASTWWFSQSKQDRWRWLIKARHLVTNGKRSAAQAAVGLAGLALIFIYLYNLPDGRLHVVFLDIGRGDATFVQTPTGRQILIDGGYDAPRTLAELGRHLPFWDRDLDLVVLTSPDDERLRGLIPVLERYQVDFVAMGAESGQGDYYERWRELLRQRARETVGVLTSGHTWELDQGVNLAALWPDAGASPGPLVLQITYGDNEILLMGDATTVAEEELVARYGATLQSEVLHAARHGVKTSSTKALLQAVAPAAAVITLGEGQKPAETVLARLMDVPIYRTDRQGAVEVVADGQSVRVRTARSQE